MTYDENEFLENQQKWFDYFKYVPKIVFWIIVVFFFIFGIVDASSGTPGKYSEYYGVFKLPSSFVVWLIWQIIGIVQATISYAALKLSLCYKILHIYYLKQINEKLNGNVADDKKE